MRGVVEKCCGLCRHPNIIDTFSNYLARLLVYCGMEITWRYIESVEQTVFKDANKFKKLSTPRSGRLHAAIPTEDNPSNPYKAL